MSKILIDEATVTLALEEMKIGNYNSAAERLEAALAEQPAQQGPVASKTPLTDALNFFTVDERLELWKKHNSSDSQIAVITQAVFAKRYTTPQPAQQEPVYVQTRHKEEHGFSDWGSLLDPTHRNSKWAEGVEMRLLYTTPQPAQQEPNKNGSPCPKFWDWLPKAYNFDGNGAFTKYNMEVAFLAGKQASQPAQRKQVGYSRFESWYSEDFDPKGKGTKQQMREAYEEGMNDPSPQPAQRKPLTDKEVVDSIQHLYQNRAVAEMAAKVGMDDYRAIEAAHGIKENT